MRDNPLLPRRRFLAAATAAICAAPLARPDPIDPAHRDVDVAIIGAGLSGLTAARNLRKAGKTVLVLEARDRVGGRTFDRPIGNGHVVEGGGEWVGPGQDRVLALAKEFNIATYESFTKGQAVMSLAGLRFKADAGKESPDLIRVKKLLDDLATGVSVSDPWTSPHAAEWDAITVGQWLARNTKDTDTLDSFAIDCETELGSPKDISLLWYLFYLRSAGGSHQSMNVDAQRWRLTGGTQQLSRRLAEPLGDALYLSSPVTKIDARNEKRIEIHSAKVVCTARRVIVAMMPADTRRITFLPELPAARQDLIRSWAGEPAFKVNVVYPKPFWRVDNLSGLGVASTGPIGVTFDNSPPDESHGVLLAFLSTDKVPREPGARKTAILKQLKTLFGKPALEPTQYIETDWSADGWTTGCVSPVPPGLLTRCGPSLRTPTGPIHWAGTETSEIWCGYMDGAIRSGERAAAEALKQLS